MDTFRSVARFVGIAVTLIFVVAVSGTFADEMGSRRHEDGLIRNQAVETYSGSRFADFNSGFSFDQDEFFGRTDGIRDGYWLRLSLNNNYSSWTAPGGDSSTAMPEPASLLLLITGVAPMLWARRRGLKA